MLGRNVLRSVPSPGLARQFLNRASTVRNPPQQSPNPLDIGGLEHYYAIDYGCCSQLMSVLTNLYSVPLPRLPVPNPLPSTSLSLPPSQPLPRSDLPRISMVKKLLL